MTSDSKDKWVYLIKNLIILDRCLIERYFVSDIVDLRLG
jgi:hypothetical protein